MNIKWKDVLYKVMLNKFMKFFKILKIVGVVIVALFLFLTGIFIYILKNPAESGNFADNVLRPVIGANNTLAIEGLMFGAEDIINHQTRKSPPKSNYVTSVKTLPVISTAEKPFVPQDIKPYLFTNSPLPGEGVWKNIS